MQYTVNTNAYVEEQAGYACDNVTVKVDESAQRVTVFLADEAGNQLAGSNLIIDETFTGATAAADALAFYQSCIAQLSEGDVIKHFDRKDVTLRDPYANDANRYPTF